MSDEYDHVHRAALRRRRRIAWAALIALSWLVACGQGGDPREAVEALAVTSARATSATSISVTFSHPVTDADDPGDYVVRDRDGARLAVVAAYVKEEGTLVILATEPQRLVDYELEVLDPTPVAGGLRAATLLRASEPVAGSAVPAPFVQSATALDATHVLVTFEDPIGPPAVDAHDDALDPDAYLLLDPSLDVREVRFADGPAPRTAVVLTTDALGAGAHRVQVGGVTVRPNRVLIDPFRNEATFGGVEAEDGTPPRVVDVRATDATTVVVQFDEPVSEGASDPSMFVLTRPDGDVLQVVAAQLTAEGTRIVLTTEPMEPGVRYSLALDGVQDVNGNVIAGGTTTEVTGTDTTEGVDTTPPRVTGATSMSSTRVLVTFSEPVQGGMESAEKPGHYEIVGTSTRNGALSAQATLLVKSATLSANGRSVVLETGPQSEIPYTLRVTNVFDEAGNPVIGPTRDRPLEVDFFGTPVSGAGVDSDGDGLTDAAEQRGWTVVVRNANGETVRSEVTSDPGDPTVPVDHPINVAARDTDQDGLGDAQEKTYLTNPRAADTDGDDLTDSDELNLVYSDPTVQDTDGDGLADGLEFLFFDTSALYADTDGDQFLDDYEVTTDNRNPRIADLPVVEIDVGNVDLQLDVRFEEQTSEGTSTVDSTTVSTTLERSESSRTENVQTDTDEWFVNAAASFCYLGGCSVDTFAVGGTVSVQGGFTRTSTSTSTNESTRAAQEAYARSLATEATVSAEASITRVVEDASLAVAVTLRNPGNVAYTVRDLEITALTQDGRDASTQVPVATLVPDSGAGIHIGPLNPTRGPFRFEARNAFPNLVEQLMQNPRGITFRIANYTLEDEHGRRFAFVQQDVNDRTAGFKINYAGNRDMELYQVATNAGFTPSGQPTGVSMASVLQGTLGLEHVAQEVDEKLDPTVRADAERIARSYSTRVIDGVEVLHRVRDVSRELTGEDRDWFVFIYQGRDARLVTPVDDNPGEDFRSVTVRSDADFGFYFVQDLDGDALQKSIELSYGSIDSNEDACDNGLFGVVLDPDRCPGSADGIFDSRDSDRDGINDNTELKGPFIGNDYRPWTIRFDDGRDSYRTSANPSRRDTDGDGLRDCQELVPTEDGTDGTPPLACAVITVYLTDDGVATLDASDGTELASFTLPSPTDPSVIDTDGDGLTDLEEVLGFQYEGLAGVEVEVRPDASGPATNPLSRDSDDDGLDDRSEIRLGTDPTTPDGATVFDDDGDGLVNVEETTPRTITVHDASPAVIAGDDDADGSQRTTASDPDVVDTDGDGLTDWEEYHGCRDLDRDLRCDPDVPSFGPTGSTPGGAVTPSDADTDRDGLNDRAEVDGVSFTTPTGGTELRYPDPVDGDTDDDGRSDGDEIDEPWQVVVAGRGGYLAWSDPMRADVDGDGLDDGQEKLYGTDPNLADTDGDGALDGLEVSRVGESGDPLTDPLTPDHLVTVTFLSIEVGRGDTNGTADGDPAGDAGDFDFELGTVKPDPETGLLSKRFFVSPRIIVSHVEDVIADGGTPFLRFCQERIESLCIWEEDFQPGTYIQVNSEHANDLGLTLFQDRFAVPFTSQFAVWGEIQEIDNPFPSSGSTIDHGFSFGGLGDDVATFEGDSLTKGTKVKVFTQADDQESYRLDVTVQVTIE